MAVSWNASPDVVDLLISAGADVDARGNVSACFTDVLPAISSTMKIALSYLALFYGQPMI